MVLARSWTFLLCAAAWSATTTGCLFAPQPVAGEAAGAVCGDDLDCANGLLCECGVCVTGTDNPAPPSCEVMPDDRCPAVASECFQACGVEQVVGLADCVEGRESCEASNGVLRADCGDAVCWGEAEPGETCLNGEFVCQFGREEQTGLCYTFDCEGEPAECVLSCQDDTPTNQICLANSYQCAVGFPIEQCGGCVGTPPACFNNCTDLEPIAPAICQANAWSCAHILDAQLPTACCEGALSLLDETTYLTHQNVTCSTGTVLVRYQPAAALELPALKWAKEVRFYENDATSISLPVLAHVQDGFSLWMNDDLVEASFPNLDYVGGSFEIAFNASFPQCRVDELVAGVDEIGGQLFLTDNDPEGVCVDGGGVDDGGVVDGGSPRDGGSVGDDGGTSDGGAVSDAGTDGGALNDGGAAGAG